MTGAQRRVVEALRTTGKVEAVYVPAAEGDAYRFAEPFVTSFGEQADHPIAKQTQWEVAQYDTRTIELRETCRAAGELLKSGVDARDIGIVARTLDPYDIALLNRFAAAEGFAISTAEETPLLAHCLGRAIATLLRLRENGFPRGDVIELLRGGFLSKRAFDIDEIDMATRRYGIAGGTSEELKSISRNAAVDAYVAVLTEIEPLAPDATLSANETADFLTNTLSRFAIETDLDLVAAEAIDDIAATFRRTNPWNVRFDA